MIMISKHTHTQHAVCVQRQLTEHQLRQVPTRRSYTTALEVCTSSAVTNENYIVPNQSRKRHFNLG